MGVKHFGAMVAVLVLLGSSGCSRQEASFAEPKSPPGAPGVSSPLASSSSSARSTTLSIDPISSSLDPCDLLSTEDLAEAGKFKTEYKEEGGARSCYWQSDFEQGGDGFTFAVSLRDAQSVETLNDLGAGVQRTEVNQRPAAVSKNAEFRSCTVAMKLDDVSRVDVSVPRTEEDDACEIAEVIAGLVEPHLPEIP